MVPIGETAEVTLIEWGVAMRTLAGNRESGDLYLVEPFPEGTVVAVVDGLGHGSSAAAAAKAAISALKGHAYEQVDALIGRCHEALAGTRGVVMSLASFNARDETMTWVGVGNVAGWLLRANAGTERARESLFLRGGVVGYRLPTLHPVVMPVEHGDTLIFATDGVRSGFADRLVLDDTPQRIAERILADYARDNDDALVLVARYIGREMR